MSRPETDDGPFMFGIASMRNTFVPEGDTDIAILLAPSAAMVVRPDPKTVSLLS